MRFQAKGSDGKTYTIETYGEEPRDARNVGAPGDSRGGFAGGFARLHVRGTSEPVTRVSKGVYTVEFPLGKMRKVELTSDDPNAP
jgi:hypothetical protein